MGKPACRYGGRRGPRVLGFPTSHDFPLYALHDERAEPGPTKNLALRPSARFCANHVARTQGMKKISNNISRGRICRGFLGPKVTSNNSVGQSKQRQLIYRFIFSCSRVFHERIVRYYFHSLHAPYALFFFAHGDLTPAVHVLVTPILDVALLRARRDVRTAVTLGWLLILILHSTLERWLLTM